jgi:hypothetical protein
VAHLPGASAIPNRKRFEVDQKMAVLVFAQPIPVDVFNRLFARKTTIDQVGENRLVGKQRALK